MKKEAEETRGKGVKFGRIRRITGYLVGTTDRFNNAKQQEERDRVKHSMYPHNCGCGEPPYNQSKEV